MTIPFADAPSPPRPADASAPSVRQMANAIRFLAVDAVERAGSGHPGMPMGMADVATVLFAEFLKFDPAAPDWPDRDRFVLSAGHGSMLLYALLHLTGYADMPLEELKRFRQIGARTAGHPEYGHAGGIETTTGPLGQGLANAVGMALAERMLKARFGDALVDHHTYAIVGDGCLMEGISHEAIDLAGRLELSRLVVLFDDNGISIDGPTSLATAMDQLKRFEAAGWSVRRVDGHDPSAIRVAIARERLDRRPSLIACRTTIGYGAPSRAGTAKAHGEPLGASEIAAARARLDWPYPPFETPSSVRTAWLAAGARGRAEREAWARRLEASRPELRAAFETGQAGDLGEAARSVLQPLVARWKAEKPTLATRQASHKALQALAPAVPALIGGSADLTGSNGTRLEGERAVGRSDFGGRNVHYGVREHAMAAAMNGLALHRGLRPYGGTFLAFSDYSRPAIRLAAIMGLPVVHVMTHDSIGLGEDGPTHQPVEHLAALRALPNLQVIRPADAVETAEAWLLALETTDMPSLLALSRQALPALRQEPGGENLVARGGYILREPQQRRDLTLLASGSEVSLACEAAEVLATAGYTAAVVSMPCFERFERQSPRYRRATLGAAPRIAVEAAVRQGWDAYLRAGDLFIGMDRFGASGPAEELYRHYGLTREAIVAAALRLVRKHRGG